MKSDRITKTKSEYFDAVEAATSVSTEEAYPYKNELEDEWNVPPSTFEDIESHMLVDETSPPAVNLYMAKISKKKKKKKKTTTGSEPPKLIKTPPPGCDFQFAAMSVVGVIFVLTGIIWSIGHYVTAPRYEPVATGQPIQAVSCVDRSALTDNETRKCRKYADNSDRSCRLAVTYNFTIGDSSEVVFTGTDLRKYNDRDDNDVCVEGDAIATYLSLQDITVWYDPEDPSDNLTYEEPTSPEGMAALLAGLFCGFGLCFLLPCLLYGCEVCIVWQDNRSIRKEWEKQQECEQ